MERLPPTLKKRDTQIVAAGEVTGHHHTLAGGDASIYGFPGNMFVVVASPSQMVHDEHGAIDLEPGIYEVTRQREWGESRNSYVRD